MRKMLFEMVDQETENKLNVLDSGKEIDIEIDGLDDAGEEITMYVSLNKEQAKKLMEQLQKTLG